MHRVLALALALLIALPVVAAPVVAATTTQADGGGGGIRVGGTVVVGANETVTGNVTAVAGTVVVRGTVEGDLEAYGGGVVIAEGGTVTGRVRAYAGSVRIAGTVEGTFFAYSGSVTLAESGVVRRSFGAAAGDVLLAGTVRGDANVGAGSIRLAPSAHVTGDLNYDGNLDDEGGRVDGRIRESSDLALTPSLPVLGPLAAIYLLLADALLGVILLSAFPQFSWTAANTVSSEPLRTAVAGLAGLVAVPVGLVLVAVTVVGIPIAVAGLAVFVVALWVGSVYGRYAIGTWLLDFADVEHRWGALALGIVLVAVLARLPVPYVGGVVRLVVLLFGVGVLVLGVRALYEMVRERPQGLSGL